MQCINQRFLGFLADCGHENAGVMTHLAVTDDFAVIPSSETEWRGATFGRDADRDDRNPPEGV